MRAWGRVEESDKGSSKGIAEATQGLDLQSHTTWEERNVLADTSSCISSPSSQIGSSTTARHDGERSGRTGKWKWHRVRAGNEGKGTAKGGEGQKRIPALGQGKASCRKGGIFPLRGYMSGVQKIHRFIRIIVPSYYLLLLFSVFFSKFHIFIRKSETLSIPR